MTIKTRVAFYYIDPITKDNNLLNFTEPNNPPGAELTATLNVGSRSMEDLVTEVQRALNEAGEETYTVTLDRITRLVTISSTDNFNLLITSGSGAGLSVFSLLGFTGADLTGSNSYTGNEAIGSVYTPQFVPQSFKAFENNRQGIQTAVSESANGTVEVVTFGNRQLMEMELMYITNRFRGNDSFIENNPNALAEARDFLEFAITKSDFEVMLDRNDRNTFIKILLERTRSDSKGTGYILNEMLNRGFEDYFTTGKLVFRKSE